VSPRARVVVLVAVVALLASTAVVGVVVLQTRDAVRSAPPEEADAPELREGMPPLALELGFRTDSEARDLRRAAALYADGQLGRAGAIFGRHGSLEARVGSAFSSWPDETVTLMGRLAALNPQSALALLHLGLARFWAGVPGATEAWQEAIAVDPDTPSAVTAGDLLHPNFAPGLPVFVPSFAAPRSMAELPPAEQLAALAAAARHGGAAAHLLYGIGLQRVGRPVSASREFTRAARVAPNLPDAQVADAVGRFDKARPEDAFSRLGPLSRRFPQAATVRFHLGLLLLWSGELKEAIRQLEVAREVEPGSPLAREAARYLERLRAEVGR
jgi:tetratricopeptide (TPR) repeat protein